jgi:lipopolysaccharide export system permease protein
VRILDAYVLRRIAKPLALVFAAFVGIFVLVDLFDHAHTFIDNSVSIGVVLSYYAHYLPLIVVLTMPVAMLLATLLSVGGLARKHEVMAMKGSGVSLYRMLAPVFLLSLVLSFASMAIAETILPPATTRRLQIEEEHVNRRPDEIHRRNVLYVCPDGAVFLARSRPRLRKPAPSKRTIWNARSRRRLTSEAESWNPRRWGIANSEHT